MFDLASAAVLGLVLYGLVEAFKSLVWGTTTDRIRVVGAFGLSLLTVMLVAWSDFSHEQVVLNRALDTLNFGSQVVIAILMMGLGVTAFKGVKAVRNIGQNENVDDYPKAA